MHVETKVETFKTEKIDMQCLKCNLPMELQKVEVNYLGNTFPVEMMTCPQCGQVYVTEKIRNKMSSVEENLEEK